MAVGLRATFTQNTKGSGAVQIGALNLKADNQHFDLKKGDAFCSYSSVLSAYC